MGRPALHLALAATFAIVLGAGCAPTQPITTWYYSSWYPKSGAGSKGGFEHARESCLEQDGLAQDAESVAVGSPEESRFVTCMNAAGWCTDAYHCDKPGA